MKKDIPEIKQIAQPKKPMVWPKWLWRVGLLASNIVLGSMYSDNWLEIAGFGVACWIGNFWFGYAEAYTNWDLRHAIKENAVMEFIKYGTFKSPF